MRSRLVGVLVLCGLAELGCGGGSAGKVETGDDGSAVRGHDAAISDRPLDLAVSSGDALADAGSDRGDATPGSDGGGGRDGAGDGIDVGIDGGGGRDAGGDAVNDQPRADGGPDADGGRVDGGADGAAPTCSDKLKNSDETDVDCGGHCGKCGADKGCLVAADCIFGMCRADHTCAACAAAADCPGTESECEHRSCTLGVCGIAREPLGTVLALQTSGDCKSRQCAADGTVAVDIDNTDLPDDRNACTNDFCMVGTPSHTTLPLNSSCGGLNHCNAAGQCVGCNVAADCPGADTACQTRTCSGQGICGFSFKAAGTKLTDPTAGDCKGLQCDALGNSVAVNDNTDLPVDNNACTTDECTAGTPAHRPVASGTGCGGTQVCDGANHCVACLSAATCPGTDTECRPRSCVNGVCGFANTVGGTAKAAQVTKDCKRVLCDGSGGEFSVPDLTDLPVDGNACTADLCNGSTPSNPPLGAGVTCGGTSVCDGAGACVACLTATTCPGGDTECHVRTCSAAHICGLRNTPVGTALASQVIGDCKKNQCDGNGSTQTINDNTDLPVDGNVCTQDLCAAGQPSNPPVASGTACATGLICNTTGSCVGCRTAADCPGADTACQTRTCSASGQCGISDVAAGMPVGAQTAGDCRSNQCDGMGNPKSVADDTDKPVDGNQCTQDLCTMGVPSNPPEPQDVACAQNGGTRCNGIAGTGAACVQCNSAAQCPGGPDNECRSRTCSATGQCSVVLTADGTVVSTQIAGDCKRSQCQAGAIVSVADATDPTIDGNACTQNLCNGATPANPPQPSGMACADNGGSVCNGMGACLHCNVASDCPGGPDTECHARVCTAGACSISFTAPGTRAAAQSPGDCLVNVCNAGNVEPRVDPTDVFVDGNACTQDLCTGGTPSNPPVASGTTCGQNGGLFCDADGTCVRCLSDANCDLSHDAACTKTHCVAGACVPVPEPANTPVADTAAGDCHGNVCDGMGAVMSVVDDTDVTVDGNTCTQDLCLGGVATNPTVTPAGSACSQNAGTHCDAAANCVPTFMVTRIGDGTSTTLTSVATPVFIEERFESDGALVRTISLPSSGAMPRPLTLSGTADSEGALALSADGHSVALAGYSAAATTAGVGSSASTAVQRAAGVIFADGTVDTSTTFGTTAFTGNNVRSAVSDTGARIWAGGNGTNPTRGVVFAPAGAVTSTVIETTSNSTRACEIVAGQLYCDAANGALGIFAVGMGLPTTGMAPITPLPGTTTDANGSYYAFVMLDMNGDGVLDTLYIADDRATATAAGPGGIQKWTLTAGTGSWMFAWASNAAAGTTGVRGLTGYASGSNVVLLATTASASPAPNAIVRLIDPGATTPPTAANITTLVPAVAGAVTVYRGIALAPR
jgi:hypothetical protein